MEDDDNTSESSEYHKIIRSQDSKSIFSVVLSDDFCGISLVDAYKDLNNNLE